MPRTRLTVEDVMTTAVVVVQAGSAIDRAELEMKFAEVRHLPVVDARNHVIGILSDRDFIKAAGHGDKPFPVGKAMSTDVITVGPTTPAARAVALLIEHKISALPVISDEEELVGIVTVTDFLGVAYRALTGVPLGGEEA
jgi:CBS-domain-containing membrane protein